MVEKSAREQPRCQLQRTFNTTNWLMRITHASANVVLGAGPNLYAYVNNNPIMLTDPLGLCAEKPNCNTVLPNGQTIGQVARSAISGVEEDLSNNPEGFSVFGAFVGIVGPHGQIDFKNNFGPDKSGALGAAGNFAYGAIASGLGYSQSFAELGAGAYARYAGKPNYDNPYYEDNSAKENLPEGYATNGCAQ